MSRRVALGGALVLVLAGCSASLPALPDGSTVVDETVAVVVLSPTFAKLVDTPTTGQVVFLSDTGKLASITTDGIDGGLVAEHDGRVYFTDQHSDFVFDGELHKIARETREYSQELLLAVDDGYVSVFNANYSEDGSYYQYDVSSGAGEAPAEQRFRHYFELVGTCDDEVYGVAVPEGYADVDTAPRSLVRIFPASDGDVTVGDWDPVSASLQEGLAIPCVDRELYFVSTETSGDLASELGRSFSGFRLRAWNVDTGALRSVALRAATGHPLAERNWEYPFLTRSSWHISDGVFYWIDGNGILLGTDLETGLTNVTGSVKLQNLQSASNRVEFRDDTVQVLDLYPSSGVEATITTYRLSDGKIVDSVTVPGLTSLAGSTSLIATDFVLLDP